MINSSPYLTLKTPIVIPNAIPNESLTKPKIISTTTLFDFHLPQAFTLTNLYPRTSF